MFALVYLLVLTIGESYTYYKYSNSKFTKDELYDVVINMNYMELIDSISTTILTFFAHTSICLLIAGIKNPTVKRSLKLKNYGIVSVFVVYIMVGFTRYLGIGKKNIPLLISFRDPIPGRNDILNKIGIFMYTIGNIISLSFYSPIQNEYLLQLFKYSKNSKIKRKLFIIINYAIGLLLAFIYPNVGSLFSIVGGIICNIIGLILPFLMVYKCKDLYIKLTNFEKIRNNIILAYLILLSIGTVVMKIIK